MGNARLADLLDFSGNSGLILFSLCFYEHLHQLPVLLVLHFHHPLEILYLLVHLRTVGPLHISLGIGRDHDDLRLWRVRRHLIVRVQRLAHVIRINHVSRHVGTTGCRLRILILVFVLICSTIFTLVWLYFVALQFTLEF